MDKEIENYEIIAERYIGDLNKSINELILQGYEPYGTIGISTGQKNWGEGSVGKPQPLYIQSMIKYKKEPILPCKDKGF